jgi:outer membrane protein TolC
MKKISLYFNIIIFSGFFLNNIYSEEIMSWQDCISEAKKNNPDLISAEETVNQQKAQKQIVGSILFPQIDANADISTGEAVRNSDFGDSTASSRDNYSYGLSAQQLIFDGFKTVNNIRSASENIKSAQENYRFSSSTIRFSLKSAFINLLRSQELINVAEEIVKIRKGNLDLINLRYQSGLEHKGALLAAEANFADANYELSKAKRDVELAQRQLTKEMGRVKYEELFVKGDFSIRETMKQKPDFEKIAENHPSFLQLVAKKNSAAYGIKSAQADYWPNLSGMANADRTNDSWPPENNEWMVGVSMNLPVFEGGLRVAQVSQAKALYRQYEANEKSGLDSVVVNLVKAWTAFQNTVENVDVQKKMLLAAEERSKIAEVQYSTGFISFDNWIIIEDDLVSAKKSYLAAQAGALLAEADWIKAKGETLEYAE